MEGDGGSTMNSDFGGKRGVVERNRASDEARSVFGERGRRVGTAQEATPSTSELWSPGAKKNGSKTPKEDRGKHVLKPEGASAVQR